MFRWIRYFVLLILLGVAVAAVLRSFVAAETLYVWRDGSGVTISTVEGTFVLTARRVSFDSQEAREQWLSDGWPRMGDGLQIGWVADARVRRAFGSSMGFAFESRERTGRRFDGVQWIEMPGVLVRQTILELPAWFVLLVLGGFPVYRLVQRDWLRRHRAASGLCVSCGFGAGPAYITCPQCGKPVRPDTVLSTGAFQAPAPVPVPTERFVRKLRRATQRPLSDRSPA
jgi:hypothetical protein